MNIDELNGRPLRLLIGGSPCFEAGTLILTKEGLKNIEDIKIGDWVYTHKNRYMPVTDIGNRDSEIYNLKAQGIFSTHVTKNHPYYTRQVKRYYPTIDGKRKNWRKLLDVKWESVENLTDKNYLSSPIINKIENPYNLTKEQCWILGRYVADGHIRYDKRSHRKNSYHYGVILSIGSHKLEYVKSKISSYYYSCYPHTKSTHRVVISNQDFVKFIIDNDFGRGAENKNIPGIILNLPHDLAKEFLDGYMSGDGCYIKDYTIYTATTISKRLAFSLALLVQKVLNVNTSITYNVPKQKRIIEGREVNQKPQYIVSYRNEIKSQTHAIIDYDDKKIWLPYKEREYIGISTVYNFSVLEDESYVANNLVVHNCTHWSIAQKNNRETKPEGLGWELFENYLIAKEKFKPDFFLYENNKSAAQPIKDQISKELGVELQYINSALVSAQNRQRFYAHNIPRVDQPEDRGIILSEIIQSGYVPNRKAYCIDASYYKGRNLKSFFDKHRRQLVFEIPVKYNRKELIKDTIEKSLAVLSSDWRGLNRNQDQNAVLYTTDNGITFYIRSLTPIECERLQTLPDNYTEGISNTQRYKCIGNGWTAEVIIHILSHIDIPKDYPIEVLSMYDGIATGRYCLDKLGYTNITYKAYEIDEYAKKVAMKNYPDIIQCGDAYQVREDRWKY